MENWLKEVDGYIDPEKTIKILIGNKSDLKAEIKVTHQDMQSFTERTKIPIIEASAKSGAKIEEAFSKVIQQLIALRKESERPEHKGVKISDHPAIRSHFGCCGA